MKDILRIKELLDLYYEGETSDRDEQQLRDYFRSGHVDAELKPYRSLFGYPDKAKEEKAPVIGMKPQRRKIHLWPFAAAIAACMLIAVLFPHQKTIAPVECTGTYVVVDGVCSDDLSLVSRYATEAIDQVTRPVGSSDILDFLDE